ncbi:class I SAM-dependent methyltransferase [Alcaligenes endophyticus]|uniref:Class I SAM-dependent methyltransferase n=1 Tax=Alcaligenes endophyticus TaxID=1929088 RepID=A0ABT8EGI6_9BURK|nr:class I SAM-dependent methyltransferase [Alcaligenes endophyticus]MCX5590020.1 class I SAM-dependent methyltransferase [Alcaligenes endophyticus]MDN4120317.1 class I SAM-dependent methyltransferase [Alcaligenes endophyticus]
MPETASVSEWVARWAHLLVVPGTVLDVACGRGRHTRWLAQRGHIMIGVDRDPESVVASSPYGEIVQADIENGPWPFAGRRFNAVVVCNYLWRPLWPVILDSLEPGGMLIYETFAQGNEMFGRPRNPEFLLQPGELLERCQGMHIIAYEHGLLPGPERVVQRIVAQRPDLTGPAFSSLTA